MATPTRHMDPGEVLFKENDTATSLYMIKAGQIRLFRPKGDGFIDLAVLRQGEVIGEMAYFDDKATRRSCSAAALVSTEIIEIPFKTFGKALESLNPWFRTIIKTLAERLRRTNESVKTLEDNQVGFGKDGQKGKYKFLTSPDILKLLSFMFLVFKSYGEEREGKIVLKQSRLKFFALEIFGFSEVKLEEFLQLLQMELFIEIIDGDSGGEKEVCIEDVEILRKWLTFFNEEKLKPEDGKMQVSNKCERILQKALTQIEGQEPDKRGCIKANISTIIDEYAKKKIPIGATDFEDAVKYGFAEEVVLGSNNEQYSFIHVDILKKVLPAISLVNAINKLNDNKEMTEKFD